MRDFDTIYDELRANQLNYVPSPDSDNIQSHSSPKMLVDFVARIVKRLQPRTILDPVCGHGMLLAGAGALSDAEILHGVEINKEVAEFASVFLGARSNVVCGDAFNQGSELLEEYDLIIADPPLGMKLRGEQIEACGLNLRSFDFSEGLIIRSASRLSEHGKMMAVVGPLFFYSSKSKKVHNAIQDAGCRISAAIHIPAGTRQNTSIASYLLLVESGNQEDIFVGQLSEDPTHQQYLVNNLMRRKPKGNPSLGRICPLSDFLGYEAFVAQENLSRLARKCEWEKYSAEAVFPQHEPMRREESNGELSVDTESLFLKLVGRGRASTQLDDLRPSKEVIHLKVDLEIADPNFLVYWFNESRVGRLSLDALQGGATIPRIRTTELLRSKIYLPPLREQRIVVEAAAYLRKIRAEADELESALFSGTESTEDLRERILYINQEDRYEDWIETLPFPLASILWRHHASKRSDQYRYEILLHFFEAAAAFLATIHLSAFMSNDEIWEENGRSLEEKLSVQNLSLDRATFGAWKLIVEKLSSVCSSIIKKSEKSPEHESLLQRIYGTPDHRVMEMLSDSDILRILQQANKIRNDWHGHRGAISDNDAKDVHGQLVDLVQQLRGIFGRNWQRYELIQPGDGRYQQGVHRITCERLMGTKTPFEEQIYESAQPLESESLYLFDSVNRSGIQLRPFIAVMPSPENQTVACFIFNRVEKDSTRWVSYHFEHESEIKHASRGVDDALAMLKRFKGEAEA
jgi:predicted RNA methylase